MLNTSPACIICLSAIKSPVSLPCGTPLRIFVLQWHGIYVGCLGHVFCQVCLEQVISSIRPLTMRHQCPTCRAAYCVGELTLNTIVVHSLTRRISYARS